MKSNKLVKQISKDVPTWHYFHHVLFNITNSIKGEINYVEIGCYAGASACLMLQRPNTNVITIDLGKPYPKLNALANIQKYNTHKNFVSYLEGASKKQVDSVKEILGEEKIDILFIDGSHKKKDVISDFKLYSPLVKKGGWIVFDDFESKECPEVSVAINELRINGYFSNYLEDTNHENEYILKKSKR